MRRCRGRGAIAALGLGAALMLALQVNAQYGERVDGDLDEKPWVEIEPQPPAYPQPEKLIEFYVGPTTTNRFFVDSASINVGSDQVIRYTLFVKTSSGVSNVSFEGIRCETNELRLYAFGRSDGIWSKARNSAWTRIYSNSLNRHHAALMREYFCPNGTVVRSAGEALDALKRGGHPALYRPVS